MPVCTPGEYRGAPHLPRILAANFGRAFCGKGGRPAVPQRRKPNQSGALNGHKSPLLHHLKSSKGNGINRIDGKCAKGAGGGTYSFSSP